MHHFCLTRDYKYGLVGTDQNAICQSDCTRLCCLTIMSIHQGRKILYFWPFCTTVLSSQATEWALLHSQAASILKQTNKHQGRKTFYFWPVYCHFVPLCLASKLQSERCFIRKLHPCLNKQTNKQTIEQTSKHQGRKTFYIWPVYCHFVPLCLAPKLQSERCFIRKLHPFPASKQSC